MKIENIPLLAAITKRAKDAARTVKRGVFIALETVESSVLTKLLGLEQFEVTKYGIEKDVEQEIIHIYGNIALEVAICPCCQARTSTIKEYKARAVRERCKEWR